MKKKEYVELGREESMMETYLIGLKWNPDDPQDFERRWLERVPFEQKDLTTDPDYAILDGADS